MTNGECANTLIAAQRLDGWLFDYYKETDKYLIAEKVSIFLK